MSKLTQQLIDYLPEGFQAPAAKALQDAEKKSASLLQKTLPEAQKVFQKKAKLVKEVPEKWKNQLFFANSLKVDGSKGKGKKRPDDEVYQENQDLQRYLPRGFTLINDRKTLKPVFLLSSFAKFFGKGKEDDDDCKMTTPVDPSAQTFIVTTKANGEMCQISGFYFLPDDKENNNADWYWVIGSKNRKILVQTKEEIDQYREEQAYAFSCPMADAWFELLAKLTQEQKQSLQDFLDQTKLTINFEYEQTANQHVIPLRTTQLVLIGLTSLDFPKGLHPAVTYAFAKVALNDCPCVIDNLVEHPIQEIDQEAHRIAQDVWDTEGAVIYALNQKHEVVDMKKVKTWRYVWQRAVREKIRPATKTRQITLCRKQTERRLTDLSKDLGIPESIANNMKAISTAFIDWCFLEAKDLDERFQTQYPNLWDEFLTKHDLPNDHSLIGNQTTQTKIPQPKEIKSSRVVLTQGIPGLGKNHIFERLAQQLSQPPFNLKVKVIAQDDFVTSHPSNPSEACFLQTMQDTYSGEYDLVILARNNSCKKQYERYLRSLDNYILIAPQELENQSPNDPARQQLLQVAITSVLQRQANQDQPHPTDELEMTELATLPFKFASVFRADPLAYRVKFLDPESEPRADPRLSKLIPLFQKKGFDTQLQPNQKADLERFIHYMDHQANQDLRRVNQELLDELAAIVIQPTHPPTHGQYLGIQLTEESRDLLSPLINDPNLVPDQAPEDNNKFTVVCDHVTLIHSNGFQANQDLWHQTAQRQGEHHLFRITRFKHVKGQLLCSEVDLQPKYNPQPPLQVSSNTPHLTMKLWNNTPAVKSLSVIQDAKTPWIDLPRPIELEGIIKLLP